MESIEAMSFYQLPPAGNKIISRHQRGGENHVNDFFPGDLFFFNSGAASLAVAVLVSIQHSKLKNPEVLLPAYACPELVSAVVFAGAKPILVDFSADRPWMDLDMISEKLTEQTCAVIAVSLFGIPERIGAIRKALQGHSALVIEDSAQAFPGKGEQPGVGADLVIYSFGRGKPVSVLGGGAVLTSNSELAEKVREVYCDVQPVESIKWRNQLKIRAYNRLLSPRLYWLPNMLPFINLGATVYHPLLEIKQMDPLGVEILGDNIAEYWRRGRMPQDLLMQGMAGCESDVVIDLARRCCGEKIPGLIRYPLLARTAELRDKLCERINKKGLGASKMYPDTLPNIKGLERIFKGQGCTPNAKSFSQRIFTLPLHEGVNEQIVLRLLDEIY